MELKDRLIFYDVAIDNEYLDLYVNLMISNKDTICESGITQRHHIIPKYYYLDNGLSVDNSSDNIVNLKYRDHILAHYYLAMCSIGKGVSKNVLSIRFLLNGKSLNEIILDDGTLNNYQLMYEMSRRDIFERTHTVEANKKISEALIGRISPMSKKEKTIKIKKSKVNPNAKNKLLSEYASKRVGCKNSFYGRKHSDESKKKISSANSIPVGMYDLVTKQLLKSFPSITSASNYLQEFEGIKSTSIINRISSVCKLNTDYNRAYGYNWRFISEV